MKTLALQVISALALAVLIFFGVQSTIESRVVEGSSMESTLHDDQRLLVVKAAYWFGEPQRGDVVVFMHPLDTERALVKRVIGLPGEQVEITGGIVYINGSPLEEPYINGQSLTSCTGSYCSLTIPEGEFFVMGDNRFYSSDSRSWGTIPDGNIVGKVWLIYWPLDDWHVVQGYSYSLD